MEPNRRPAPMLSKQWSASTLNEGLDTVRNDVKAELWTDGEDDTALLQQMQDQTKGSVILSRSVNV